MSLKGKEDGVDVTWLLYFVAVAVLISALVTKYYYEQNKVLKAKVEVYETLKQRQ